MSTTKSVRTTADTVIRLTLWATNNKEVIDGLEKKSAYKLATQHVGEETVLSMAAFENCCEQVGIKLAGDRKPDADTAKLEERIGELETRLAALEARLDEQAKTLLEIAKATPPLFLPAETC